VYNYPYDSWGSCHDLGNNGATFLLHNLFDQTLDTGNDHFFLADTSKTTVTLDLKGNYHVNRLKVYPTRGFLTKFKV
jgi:hypothetical protein